jgi:hypothetical protein
LVTAYSGLPQWNAGIDRSVPAGRVIVVKQGDVTRRIGIDGSAEAIKDAIRSVFGLRTKRTFWLEDEDGVVRCFDRDMPLRTYNLHIDPGLLLYLYVIPVIWLESVYFVDSYHTSRMFINI